LIRCVEKKLTPNEAETNHQYNPYMILDEAIFKQLDEDAKRKNDEEKK
jgi:hypothetical protein